MLYVFHGTDTDKVLAKANGLMRGLLAKRAGAQVFRFEGEQLTGASLDEVIEAQGLFVERHIIVLRRPFETETGAEIVLARVVQLAATNNVVILTEHTLSAEQKRTLEKHAARMEEHRKAKTEKQEYNVFGLADLLGARNAKALWLAYGDALRSGITPENILGTLSWSVKNMLLASGTTSAEEAGLKPFPYDKAKRSARNFTESELLRFSHELITMYHTARRKNFNLAAALERWVLGL